MPWWDAGKWLDQVKVRFKPDELNQYYRHVFDSPSGEIVLADLMREGGLLATGLGATADQVMFAAGERHMATYILARLGFQPQQVQLIRDMQPLEDEDA